MMKNIIEVKNLSVTYNGQQACENVSFSLPAKQIIGIIGPNGGGKSTLVKAIVGLVGIEQGNVKIMNQPVDEICKKIAYVPQRSTIDFDFPVLVEDVVMMGRFPHTPWWAIPSSKDKVIVNQCLKKVGMFELRKRQIGELSGGQQQRVFIARALAQEADILFLDEPFSGIDITSENMIMDLLKKLCKEGKTAFIVHHDLSKVEKYFDSIIMLKTKLIAYGKCENVFKISNLKKAYSENITTIESNKKLMAVNI